LRLSFRIGSPTDNSGVLVRSRDPRRPVPDRNNPAILHTYDNRHWVAVDTGFEIQIDDTAGPDGQDQHRTGAIYGAAIGGQPGQQNYQRPPALATGQWNDYEIEVRGDCGCCPAEVACHPTGRAAGLGVKAADDEDPAGRCGRVTLAPSGVA
jgi:hypothetical protein